MFYSYAKKVKMSLNPVQWTRAQQLLLDILQAVSPIASGNPGYRSAVGEIFKKNSFPSQGDLSSLSTRFPYAVRLLTRLHSAREEMTDLLEAIPQERQEGLQEIQKGSEAAKQNGEKAPAVKNGRANQIVDALKEKTEGGPLAAGEKPSSEKPATPLAKESSSQKPPALAEKGSERATTHSIHKSSTQKTFEQISSQRSEGIPKEKKPPPTLSGQAVRLIDQVRDAIRNLSTSGNLVDPKPGPLRDALQRLKPMIDAFIEAVSQSDMHTPSDGFPPSTRFALPKSAKEHLKIPFPRHEATKEPASIRSATVQRQNADRAQPKETDRIQPKEMGSSEPLKRARREESISNSYEFSSPNKMPPPPNPMTVPVNPNIQPYFSPVNPYRDVQVPIKNQDADTDAKSVDRLSLPAAPFTPEMSRSTSNKKKKRKRFWSRESPEEDEKEPN